MNYRYKLQHDDSQRHYNEQEKPEPHKLWLNSSGILEHENESIVSCLGVWWWWGLIAKRQKETLCWCEWNILYFAWWLHALYIDHYITHNLYINKVFFRKDATLRLNGWFVHKGGVLKVMDLP